MVDATGVRPGGADTPMLHHASEAILAHPCFAAARRAYVQAILALYEHHPFMNRLLVEAARSIVFINIVCLHFAYDEADRSTWPTLSLLQQTVAFYGLSSARRIEAMVARFIQTGYVHSSPAPADRRARILRPSDKMLAHDLDWIAAHYEPLQAMFPDVGYASTVRRIPEFHGAQRIASSALSAYAATLMAQNPDVMLFMGRDAGFMVLIKLFRLAQHTDGRVPGRVSFADLGLVLLSHVGITLTPRLRAAFDRFVADTMAGHDLIWRRAVQQLQKPVAASPDHGRSAGLGAAVAVGIGANAGAPQPPET